MHRTFFLILSMSRLKSARCDCYCTRSRGHAPVAAGLLGISHLAENCFSSHASGVKKGGGGQREDFMGGIESVASL